jgi:large subunit ribosomal protein L3
MIGAKKLIEKSDQPSVKLPGIFAFKVGMSTVYNEDGVAVPVTVLKYEPWFVSQVKKVETDGYNAVQLSCGLRKKKNSSKASMGHVKKAGAESAPYYSREFRSDNLDGIEVGAALDIESLSKGDLVKVTAKSKGHGFSGSVRRWNFAGGPASHGSNFHRRPGSSGNRTWPGRVMPGKKFPGQWGAETVTVRNLEIVEVNPDLNVLLVKGAVPGARNSLVKLVRE